MDAKVTWQGKMRFEGTASDSGYMLPLDAGTGVGGEEQGFRPLELMAMSLAGCTAMDVISILRKKRQAVESFEVRVHADQANEHPRVFTHLRIEYIVTGENIDPAAVRRAIELSETKYCPAQSMLNKVAPTELTFTINGTPYTMNAPV